MATKIAHSHTALQAETMAIREALRFAQSHPQILITIESDCLTSVKLSSNPSDITPWEVSAVLEEIWHLT